MRIGLTGGLGCGVSEVARILAEKGVPVVSGDRAGHKALTSDDIKAALVERFGASVVLPDGTVDRRTLGGLVFSDRDALRDLNRIIHPTLLQILQKETIEQEQKSGVVIVDAALIYEWELTDFFDCIIAVTAPLETRLLRVMRRDGLSRGDALQRLQAQLPIEEKAKRADYVIINDGSLEKLRTQTEEIWKRINDTRKNSD